ncbi:MAG: lipopolysaccharide kinase InaA family protein [Planctomycetota bacterium]
MLSGGMQQTVVSTKWGSFLVRADERTTAASAILAAISAHDAVEVGTRCLKSRPTTKVTHVDGPATGPWPQEIVVKEVRAPLRRRVGHALGARSRFAGDFAIHGELTARAIRAPELLAASQRPRGGREYQITSYLRDCPTLRAALWLPETAITQAPQREAAITALGQWVRAVHDAGVWQRDLKLNNVLVGDFAQAEFYLLDFSDVRFFTSGLSKEKRVRNLGQVLDVPTGLEEEFTSTFLPAYCGSDYDESALREPVAAAVEARREHRLQKDGFRYVDEPIATFEP